MDMPKKFMEAAQELAISHAQEESVQEIYLGNSDPNDTQVIRLLEINNDTIPVGIEPVYFMRARDFTFASCIIEVTRDEFNEIPEQLELPEEWIIGESLFKR